MGADRHQDVAGPDAGAGLEDVDRVRVLDHGAAVDDLDAGLLEIGPVDALEPVDLLVLVADQGRPVEAGLADVQPKPAASSKSSAKRLA